jgi:nicotinamide-nucleotide amidase
MTTRLAKQVGKALKSRDLMLATAESCTGGAIAYAITKVSGSSDWFDRGFITYSNTSKEEMLGVSPHTLKIHGAVSEATAREMADGALQYSRAEISLAVTGIAGPTGGTQDKPVGTVWFAWVCKGRTKTVCHHISGDRDAVRVKATHIALQGVLSLLNTQAKKTSN